jgi:hypothetical protein
MGRSSLEWLCFFIAVVRRGSSLLRNFGRNREALLIIRILALFTGTGVGRPFLLATCPFGSGSSTFSQVDRTVKQVAPSESDDNGTGIARSGRLDRQHIGMVRLCDLRLPFAHDVRPLFPGQGRDSFHSGCFCGIRGRISNNPNAPAALRCASFGCLRQKTR